MKVRRFFDARAFSEHVGPMLMRQELENNVPLGIVRRLVAKPNDAALMIAVEDSDQPIFAAVMTPPFKLVLSTGPAVVLAPLVEHLRADGIALPGAMSLATIADAFAAAWAKHDPGGIERQFDVKLLALGTAPPATATPGMLRAGTADDIALLRDWGAEFHDEVGFSAAERDSFVARLDDMIAVRRLWLWEDGDPVCLLGYSETTVRAARIGPVFTPRIRRGKGYATAAVSALTRRLLADGRAWCLLFADVSNPTAMGMYRRIGFQEVALYREYVFEP
jgi:hypothetical protein